MSVSRSCDGARSGDEPFDLVRVSVDERGSDYLFTADYSGDPARHDVLIRF
jgi:hypothetical protein